MAVAKTHYEEQALVEGTKQGRLAGRQADWQGNQACLLCFLKWTFCKLICLEHRYLKNSRLSKLVMCLLRALPLPGGFLQQTLTALTRQT